MYQIEYAYTCHMGRVRANNEDNLWCCGESLPADNQGMEGVHSQIVSGLKPGESFVSGGAFELKSILLTSGMDAHAGHGH